MRFTDRHDWLVMDATREAGDVLVRVEVAVGDYRGAREGWMLVEGWRAFITDLERLDRERRGEAILEALSPQELRLRFFATDAIGHLAIEGVVSQPSIGFIARAQLVFALEFEPDQLAVAIRELQRTTGSPQSGR